ncbi:hypothetical protein [Nocardioides jejuensis]|uniref:AMP-dependent synthetase/ligase domain-containing protein n=1 Tax=Nocardioides jejuensis TaxID=2502782 RepID=A0A4R1BXE2_9ACTN|nr:hypothetical protein [Nocardioides jejuensis]TCJ22561.1 hypothetical protein EPD65_12510 [Nocardioides jejuensis]
MATRTDLTWFRAPGADRPGTTNLCYHALDRRVINGEASSPALSTADRTYDVAALLEEVGALAGAMRSFDLAPGQVVAIGLGDPLLRALSVLATLRLGAVVSDSNEGAAMVLTDGSIDPVAGVPALLHGPEPVDPVWQLEWQFALKAGRTNPAPVVDVAGDATALSLAGATVLTRDVVAHDSEAGRLVAALGAGEVVAL